MCMSRACDAVLAEMRGAGQHAQAGADAHVLTHGYGRVFSCAFGALAARQLDSSHVLFEEVRINPRR